MCYNAASSLEKAYRRAINASNDLNEKKQLELELLSMKDEINRLREIGEYNRNADKFKEDWKKRHQNPETGDDVWYTSAFAHEKFPALILEDDKRKMVQLNWGLVPRWCKDAKTAVNIWSKTVNSRSETMFELRSFKASAHDRRCIIFMTGWFEYHHQGKKKYPFFIRTNDAPCLAIAGLWDQTNIDGQVWQTFTVVTTSGNEKMKLIHNNPTNPNRMPVVLRDDQFDEWLTPTVKGDELTIKKLESDILLPYPSDGLEYYPVGQLQGKNGIGNQKAAQEKMEYPDLELVI